MKKTLIIFSMLSTVLSLVLFSSIADALPIDTTLNISNTDSLGVGEFAWVNVTLTGEHTVTFTVNANESLLGLGDNFGIQRFGFNTALDLAISDFSLPDTKWGVSFDRNISEFGIFYAEESGTGKTRQDPLIFSVTNSGINDELQFFVANDGGYHYFAHIAGFDNFGEVTSAYFSDSSAPVPEPATLMLLGSGLLGLAGFRKRK